MWRNTLSLSLALVLAAAGTGHAAGHGGGGFHSGGFHGGSYLGGFHGGYHYPGYHYSYHPGARYGTYYHPGYPRNYRGYYGGYYGAWPYYGYYNSIYPYDSGAGYWDGTDAGTTGSFQYLDNRPQVSTTAQHDAPAEVTVTLPADATLWVEGKKMLSTGPTREIVSPALQVGHRYSYGFKASWKENGHTVTERKTVSVSPAAHVHVQFPLPATKSRTASAH
jgi:uncharacterized protein (TIGR03000 family)